MRVLVTGGAGYVGGYLVDLIKSFHEVVVYDSLLFDDFYVKRGVKFINGDVRDKTLLKKWLDWADCVIHLAALVGDGACAVNPAVTLDVNRESVKFICENFKGRIIYPSTCSIYGAQHGILTEETAGNPLSAYAISKYQSEDYLKAHSNAIIFRLGTLFGLSDSVTRPRLDLVANVMVVHAFTAKKINVFGGEQWRPLLHVRDVGRAMAQAVNTKDTGIFNLSLENVLILDIAKKVKSYFPEAELKVTDLPFEDLRNYRVDNSKMKNVFSFKPSYSLDEGLIEIKEAVESGAIKRTSNPRYHNHNFLKHSAQFISDNLNFPPSPELQKEVENLKISSVV
jgi:nucleoside-diphosphate-sugar epimerase